MTAAMFTVLVVVITVVICMSHVYHMMMPFVNLDRKKRALPFGGCYSGGKFQVGQMHKVQMHQHCGLSPLRC